MGDRSQHHRFHGLFDTVAEMGRMREFWQAGIDPPQEERTHATAWIPRMDIFAHGEDLVIRCELAGVPREDMDISLDDNTLTIFGERTGAPAVEDKAYYVRERQYGGFRRTINLPEGTDRSSIAASLEDGLLEVTVTGGAARREPERIEIQASGGER